MVSFADIAAAHERIRGQAKRTPVLTSSTVDALAGASVFFKCENFQRMGAFKFRGAFNALSQLNDEQRGRGENGPRGSLEKALADARAHRDEARASGNEEETAKAQSVVDELKARIAKGEEGKPRPEEGRRRQGGEGIEMLRKEVQGLREHIHRIEEILARLEAMERQ